MPALPAVVLDGLCFDWPDGTPALTGLTGTFGRGRTGLIGANGAGKSTLLRLIAGRLRPRAGSIGTLGSVDYLPQTLTLDVDATLADLLGVRAVVDAVRAIEAGDTDPVLFDLVRDDWDLEARSVAALAEARLPAGLDRPVATLSGGETVLAALVGIRLRGASVALLDEPTNNLDGDSRTRLHDLVRSWRGTLIVVSHDLDLLELMDTTTELREGSLDVFGGPYSEYRAAVERDQAAAQQSLRTAEQLLRTERRQRIEAEQKIAHAERQGRKDKINRRYVPAALHDRRNSAEKSAGARRGMLDAKIDAARAAVEQAEARVRDDDRIRVDLPDPQVPFGRRLAELTGSDGRRVVIQGPERIALTGPNGVGKTTLIEQLVRSAGSVRTGQTGRSAGPEIPDRVRDDNGAVDARTSAVALTERIGYLPQRLDGLDDRRSVLANVQAAAPNQPAGVLRNRLARFLLRGDAVERPVATLSGGERFRVALARVLLADPPAQLLVLDEPTNNLDLTSVRQLSDALVAWRGALLVVSHDRGFLSSLGLDAELVLHPDGHLTPRYPGT
ncbi:MAG: ABC-F family ATP-binding cassette domain-containing protein [Propionibacteriaceae bacterium]|nr:ABC-F family ATP-binding cassette domain-containing protein [Propionibacteriaceae bacterium]